MVIVCRSWSLTNSAKMTPYFERSARRGGSPHWEHPINQITYLSPSLQFVITTEHFVSACYIDLVTCVDCALWRRTKVSKHHVITVKILTSLQSNSRYFIPYNIYIWPPRISPLSYMWILYEAILCSVVRLCEAWAKTVSVQSLLHCFLYCSNGHQCRSDWTRPHPSCCCVSRDQVHPWYPTHFGSTGK